jgi:hypothetical protein
MPVAMRDDRPPECPAWCACLSANYVDLLALPGAGVGVSVAGVVAITGVTGWHLGRLCHQNRNVAVVLSA